MAYRVQIQNFEGPLDLLLFLIKRNEVDIYDIPIAEITKQYLAYLEIIELLDLENAGDFVLLTATLIRIKAQMLLPKPVLEDEEVEDPRTELVQRLLEYQRYKEVALNLADIEQKQRGYFQRNFFDYEFENNFNNEKEKPLHEVSFFDLMSVFVEIMKKVPPKSHYTVEHIVVTIDEQSEFILAYLDKREQTLFTELFTEIKERIIMIVTFVALLELVKNKRVQISQSKPFAEIWICRN
ncbi:MAG: segregation and condensation protein A [bacterium]